MKSKIILRAKEDIPLYFQDFKEFWDKSNKEISEDDLYEIYRSTLIFKNWKNVFQSIELKGFSNILNELYEDVNSSFFLAMLGLYRSAHMHMRSSIELMMQLLYFIHHPIELSRWQNGDFVIKHSDLSIYLATHPNFDTDVKSLLEGITKDWKHFSKHIHGESPIFFQCEKDVRKTNTFSIKDYGIWKTNFIKITYKLNKLMLLFFKNDINRFPENSRNILTGILTEDDKKLVFNK